MHGRSGTPHLWYQEPSYVRNVSIPSKATPAPVSPVSKARNARKREVDSGVRRPPNGLIEPHDRLKCSLWHTRFLGFLSRAALTDSDVAGQLLSS